MLNSESERRIGNKGLEFLGIGGYICLKYIGYEFFLDYFKSLVKNLLNEKSQSDEYEISDKKGMKAKDGLNCPGKVRDSN